MIFIFHLKHNEEALLANNSIPCLFFNISSRTVMLRAVDSEARLGLQSVNFADSDSGLQSQTMSYQQTMVLDERLSIL